MPDHDIARSSVKAWAHVSVSWSLPLGGCSLFVCSVACGGKMLEQPIDAVQTSDGGSDRSASSRVALGGDPSDPGGHPRWTPKPICGNGCIENDERCDSADLGAETCATVTGMARPFGTLWCTPDCRFDTSRCWASDESDD